MIKRDEYGFIGQHNKEYPNYFDNGDSASRCGIMSMCGSKLDQDLIDLYINDNLLLVRHPNDKAWNKDSFTSRDQLVCYAAGAKFGSTKISLAFKISLALLGYARSWFINKDILTPEVKLMLYKASYFKAPLYIKLLGYPMMLLKIFYNCLLNPGIEQNQIICMCAVYGKWWLKLLKNLHPDLNKNLYDYWGGQPWRDQNEIAVAMIDFIERETR